MANARTSLRAASTPRVLQARRANGNPGIGPSGDSHHSLATPRRCRTARAANESEWVSETHASTTARHHSIQGATNVPGSEQRGDEPPKWTVRNEAGCGDASSARPRLDHRLQRAALEQESSPMVARLSRAIARGIRLASAERTLDVDRDRSRAELMSIPHFKPFFQRFFRSHAFFLEYCQYVAIALSRRICNIRA